jgi:AcrR family transcriptional regulator
MKESTMGSQDSKRHPKAKKSSSEQRILDTAIDLFSRKWYGTVSIAEICRAAGLSNGVFYRYFENKETIFRIILEQVLQMIRAHVEGIPRNMPGTAEALKAFATSIMSIPEHRKDLISIFREGQYRFLEYERRLVAIYTRGLSATLGRDASLAEYLFAFGGMRFCAIRRSLQGVPSSTESVLHILEHGIFGGMSFDSAKVFAGSATPLPMALNEDARTRLLKAGKKLFGEKGYFATNIHEITDAAGLSVGAFYVYFESKEAFYASLISSVGREVRSFISSNLATGPSGSGLNRLERELRGLWLFLAYLSLDRDCYAIVREAEFVLPDAVRDYYESFVNGYKKNPEGNAAPESGIDEATAINFLLGIAHYTGIEMVFENSSANIRMVVETLGSYLSHGFSKVLLNLS